MVLLHGWRKLEKNTDFWDELVEEPPRGVEKFVTGRLTTVVIDYLDLLEIQNMALLWCKYSRRCANTSRRFLICIAKGMEKIAKELKKTPDVPLLGFARDAPYAISDLQRVGYDCVTSGYSCG